VAKLNETKIGKLRWDASKRTQSGKVPQFQPVNDDAVGGLHVRIYPPKPNGLSAKVFWIKYGPSVKRRSYRIGAWGDWTLSSARIEARKIRKDFYDLGIDPNRARQQQAQDAERRLTVSALVERYLHDKEPVWAASYLRNNRLHAKRLVAACGSRYAEELTKIDVVPIFLRIKQDAPAQAGLFKKFGKGLFDWACDWERVPDMPNPFVLERGNSSASSQYKTVQQKRSRHLEYKKGEATQLFDLLADYDSRSKPGTQSYLAVVKLYLLLGWRSAELRNARYEHIDHGQGTIRNVRPKKTRGGDNAYSTPLTGMAYDLIGSLGRGHIRFRTGPLFPGRDPEEPLSKFNAWHRVIIKGARMPVCPTSGHIQVRDLRRSGVTWLQQMGVTDEDRTIFKGSKIGGVTSQVYSQADAVDIRLRCVGLIEDCIRAVEAGDEATMFDKWRASTAARSAQ